MNMNLKTVIACVVLCVAMTAVTAAAAGARHHHSGVSHRAAAAAVAADCPLGFLPCSDGSCAMFTEQCGKAGACAAGSVICPATASGAAQCAATYEQCALPAWLDPNQSIESRVAALVDAMNLTEKIGQLINQADAIPRLGIPKYDWLNEALHGSASSSATVFPQIVNIGATFNESLFAQLGRAISDELRAIYNLALRQGERDAYHGVSVYTPNLNVFRDPRWGRGQEVVGEDPFLLSRYAATYVPALQFGPDTNYLQTVACCKHYVAYSLEDAGDVTRMEFDALVSDADMLQTYTPAFRSCVQAGRGQSVMCSYNAVNGVPMCANEQLLDGLLREEWGFEGFVISDYGAVAGISYAHHYLNSSQVQAAALAINAGCDQDGMTWEGSTNYKNLLPKAVSSGLVKEERIDSAVSRLFTARIKLGLMDPPAAVSYNSYPASLVSNAAHLWLARDAAANSFVLLHNPDDTLPLDASSLQQVAVIGSMAADATLLLGNYAGTPKVAGVSVRDGLTQYLSGSGVRVSYSAGCKDFTCSDASGFDAAATVAAAADATVLVLGLSLDVEAEAKDRTTLALPGQQGALVTRLRQAVGKRPLVLLLIGGGSMAVGSVLPSVDAAMWIGYPGQMGGLAVADVLFGDRAPAGRLTSTWLQSDSDLPEYTNMSMTAGPGRTYRYFGGKPLFPFGYGLSYTTFDYTAMTAPTTVRVCDAVDVTVTLRNSGDYAASEVVQVYWLPKSGAAATRPTAPRRQLATFTSIYLQPGESRKVSLTVSAEQQAVANEDASALVVEPGVYRLTAGHGQPDFGEQVLETTVTVTGTAHSCF